MAVSIGEQPHFDVAVARLTPARLACRMGYGAKHGRATPRQGRRGSSVAVATTGAGREPCDGHTDRCGRTRQGSAPRRSLRILRGQRNPCGRSTFRRKEHQAKGKLLAPKTASRKSDFWEALARRKAAEGPMWEGTAQ